jgi:hypothetical protein
MRPVTQHLDLLREVARAVQFARPPPARAKQVLDDLTPEDRPLPSNVSHAIHLPPDPEPKPAQNGDSGQVSTVADPEPQKRTMVRLVEAAARRARGGSP